MNDAHQYLSALSAEQKAEKLRLELAQLRAEVGPLKERMKAISTQLKELKPVAAHVHGPDCGAACTPLETKSLPPEEEVKIGEPVPLEAEAAVDPEPSKERAPGDPVWVPKLVKKRIKTENWFKNEYPKHLRKYCHACKVEFTPHQHIMVNSKAVQDRTMARKIKKGVQAASQEVQQQMIAAGEDVSMFAPKEKKVKKERVYNPQDYDGRCPVCKRFVRLDVSVWVAEEDEEVLVGYVRTDRGIHVDTYKFSMWHIGFAQEAAKAKYKGCLIYNTGAKTPAGRAEFLTPLLKLPPGSCKVPDFPGFDKVAQHVEKFEEWLKSAMYTGTQRSIPEYELQLIAGPAPPAGGGGRPAPQIRSL